MPGPGIEVLGGAQDAGIHGVDPPTDFALAGFAFLELVIGNLVRNQKITGRDAGFFKTTGNTHQQDVAGFPSSNRITCSLGCLYPAHPLQRQDDQVVAAPVIIGQVKV